MSPENINKIADKIIERLEEKGFASCGLSSEEMQDVKGFIAAKKKATKYGFWLIGAVVLWMAKDVYQWLSSHIYLWWR